jgi:hypothetical protein
MKKSKLLEEARTLIQSGEEEFICIAIGLRANALQWSNGWQNTDSVSKALVDWIHCDLFENKYYHYGHWLEEKHPELVVLDPDYLYKEARLQWLDWMIEYWKEKGD